MMRGMFFVAFFVLSSSWSCVAFAQRATVQQPVIRRFSVGTTVSVPDRGRAFLGGVSRAGESRKSFGPFRPGTATGLFREHSGISVGVTIHDFDEMDRFLLNRKLYSGRMPLGKSLAGNAEHAYKSLIGRHVGTGFAGSASSRLRRNRRSERMVSSAISTVQRSGRTPVRDHRAGLDLGHRFFALGLRAERRGKSSIARLHYKTAAKYGSSAAAKRLGRSARNLTSAARYPVSRLRR